MAVIQELREQRNVVAREMDALLKENPGDKWTAQHGEKFDALEKHVSTLDAEIERTQKVLDLTASQQQQQAVQGAVDRSQRDNPNPANAFLARWLRGGDQALSPEEWTNIRNTMSVGTSSQGGYTVQTEVAKRVLDALKAYGGMRDVATVITTEQGNPINYPTSDGTSETGELLAENAPANPADPTFGVVSLAVYKYSSKVVTVPIELVQDSSVDLEPFVNGRIATRLGRITNNHYTLGTGSGQPNGIVTATSAGRTGATGQTTTVIYDDMVELIHSVDPAYRGLGNSRFMMHDSSVKVIRKLKDTVGRPIWTPNYDDGIIGAVPDTLLGYPIRVNQDMPVMAANAKSILFGDFSFYTIRDVMELTYFRFTDSAYASKGQVGFLAFLRSGGNFVDVGGAVKQYVNSAT